MATWEICYEADGVRYHDLVADASYGSRPTLCQIEALEVGLCGDSGEVVRIVWIRCVGADGGVASVRDERGYGV